MSDNLQLVDIPKYAKLNKRGNYYAFKKDMPYYADEPEIKGYITIGNPSDVEGKMIPRQAYHDYCTEESYQKKLEYLRLKKEEEAAEEKRAAEIRETMEKNFGEMYFSLDELKNEISCYPVKGFLIERFFEETGLGDILDNIFGPDTAYFLKLSSGLLASYTETLSFDSLNAYPLKKHMLSEMNRFRTTKIWASIKDDDSRRFFDAWIQKVNPKSVSGTCVRSTMTLYHDQYSDSMGEGWFGSRIRTGTKYYADFIFYRDEKTHLLLAPENKKYDFKFSYSFDDYTPSELYTIENSDYPAFRDASFRLFYPSFYLPATAKKRPSTFCLHPTEELSDKELNKKLKELEQMPIVSGYRILKWNGAMKDVEGVFTLVEHVSLRDGIEDSARNILRSEKNRLQSMSFHPAFADPSSCYFEIEKEDDESDVFDNLPFTVKSVPGATKRIRQDYGRYLFFSTEPPVDDSELIAQTWRNDDLIYQYTAYMNQGHTVDVTDEYFDAMSGRELPMFLASMFREWIFDHIGDLFEATANTNDPLEVTPFLRNASKWRCTIQTNGTVEPTKMDDELKNLLKRFDVTPDDVIHYLSTVIRQKDYFSDKYKYEW